MAKRKATTVKPVTPKKVVTPENPKSSVPSAVQVNSTYDEMPDVVEDPASVFRMAMLDMRRVAANNKLAFMARDQEQRVAFAVAEQKRVLSETKAELHDAERQLMAQKNEIETKYGIALRAYTYDDETGILKKSAILIEELEAKAAVKAQKDSVENPLA